MPTIQCQHCHQPLEQFYRVCSYCDRRLLATSAIRFIGEGLSEYLRATVSASPEKAKKKTTLYLKCCQTFLCDSELALVSATTFRGRFDERTYEAIEDVIGSHRQHATNLNTVSTLITGAPLLVPVVKRLDLTNRRLDNLLQKWLVSDFGGRTFG